MRILWCFAMLRSNGIRFSQYPTHEDCENECNYLYHTIPCFLKRIRWHGLDHKSVPSWKTRHLRKQNVSEPHDQPFWCWTETWSSDGPIITQRESLRVVGYTLYTSHVCREWRRMWKRRPITQNNSWLMQRIPWLMHQMHMVWKR